MINKDNYQAYFLDYIEGNLSPMELENLLSFLDEYPELKRELSDYEEITVSPQQVNFPKENIYQVDYTIDTITEANFSAFATAFIEGDLPENRLQEFKYFINESEDLKKEFALFEQTKLKPDLTVTYANKSSLKRKASVLPMFYRISSAAAILLFFYLSFFNSNNIIEEFPKNNFSFENSYEKENLTPTNNLSASNVSATNNSKVKQVELSSNTNLPDNPINLIKVAPISSRQILLVEKGEGYQLSKVAKSLNVNTKPVGNEPVQSDDFLSPKEFIATLFKKSVLKLTDDSPDLTFSDVLTGVSNEKISFPTRGNQRMIAISTKNFSFEKKISN